MKTLSRFFSGLSDLFFPDKEEEWVLLAAQVVLFGLGVLYYEVTGHNPVLVFGVTALAMMAATQFLVRILNIYVPTEGEIHKL